MLLRKWDDLPEFMKCDEVRIYYNTLEKKRGSLVIKRLCDIFLSVILLVVLLIPMIVIAMMIKLDSPGPVFYRQERVTSYGKLFRIHKFRTMVNNADKIGTAVSVRDDARITKVGSKIRDLRIDELPQLIDVFVGNMSFVGTRPEATKYVKRYTNEMNATLLLPAGITSEASIRYKDEAKLLDESINADKTYIEQVLPEKMVYNLESIVDFSLKSDILTLLRTILAVLGKDYK